MISFVLLLIRTSTLSVLFLAAAFTTLANVLSREPEDSTGLPSSFVQSLAPIGRVAGPSGGPLLKTAIFDPERRPETLAGSIDDLRVTGAPAAAPVDVVISGVLISGTTRRVMLARAGGPPQWFDAGADVGGWRIASIEPDGARLEQDGRALMISMADRLKARSQAHSGASDAAPAAPAPAPDGAGSPPRTSDPDPLTPPDGGGPAQP